MQRLTGDVKHGIGSRCTAGHRGVLSGARDLDNGGRQFTAEVHAAQKRIDSRNSESYSALGGSPAGGQEFQRNFTGDSGVYVPFLDLDLSRGFCMRMREQPGHFHLRFLW
jgi:hypothetical protein